MKWIVIVASALAVLLLLVYLAGRLRPASHVASVTVRLAAPPESVYAVITDFGRVPEWFDQVAKAERLEDRDGRPAWRESYGGFEATSVVTEQVPGRRVVREILPSGPFHGSWTWELEPEGTGTRLVITERGTVDNAFFRGMMFFHDNTKTGRDYARALGRRLGVEADLTPR